MRIAVLGATGTAGSRAVRRLKDNGITVVRVSRSTGVDLITGAGLPEALHGVDAVIDTSNTFPADDTMGLHEAITSATRNVVQACAEQQVQHLVLLSIIGVHNPVFDAYPYYVAKRAQESIVADGPVPSTIVQSSQWHEFATNPAAVTFQEEEIVAQDWLIQPVAADSVADVLVDSAIGHAHPTSMMITGPEVIRLPELTGRLMARLGDTRPVRTVPPSLAALGEGVLLAPEPARVLPPDVDAWLDAQRP